MEDRIEINPKVMVGKPVIKGTRITVELILEKLAAGYSFERIVADHPHLSVEEISSAVKFALDILRHDFPAQKENENLLTEIDAAYSGEMSEAESEQVRLMKKKAAEVFDEWK
ncbi:MAG TPA: DUF433 domain-containing protein [Pyrinomonadaceae bacterium]